MSRESSLKDTAAGLQPKSLDLTRLAAARVASRVKSARSVPTDEAAYALGSSTMDLMIDGELVPGSPLAADLLRMKYAQQMSLKLFAQAHHKLLSSYGGITKLPHVLQAISCAALVEWLKDSCPKCRGAERGASKAHPCGQCRTLKYGRVETEPYLDPLGAPYLARDGTPIERRWASASPLPGCPKCGGLGRVFTLPKERRGVRCTKCANSGRLSFSHRERFRLVNDLIIDSARAHGVKRPKGLRLSAFSSHWARRHGRFLEVLASIDRHMGAGLDYGFRANPRRSERLALRGVDADGHFDEQEESGEAIDA